MAGKKRRSANFVNLLQLLLFKNSTTKEDRVRGERIFPRIVDRIEKRQLDMKGFIAFLKEAEAADLNEEERIAVVEDIRWTLNALTKVRIVGNPFLGKHQHIFVVCKREAEQISGKKPIYPGYINIFDRYVKRDMDTVSKRRVGFLKEDNAQALAYALEEGGYPGVKIFRINRSIEEGIVIEIKRMRSFLGDIENHKETDKESEKISLSNNPLKNKSYNPHVLWGEEELFHKNQPSIAACAVNTKDVCNRTATICDATDVICNSGNELLKAICHPAN